jgi:alanine dehydrogenase
MLQFTEDDVKRLLPMEAAIEQLRTAFAALASGQAQNQARRRLALPTGAMLHSLAGAFGNYFGTKVYSTHPEHGAHFTVLLYNATTGKPLAQFEANHLGQIRTGAASGLAIDLLAPARALKVGILGSGFQAQTQLAALRSVRRASQVRVWSRKQESRQAFAQREGAEATETAAEAVEDADVVITATSGKDPLFELSDVQRGALIAAMGSNLPNRRELPAELVREAFVVADDKAQSRIEAGDLLMALDESGWNDVVELKTLVKSGIPQERNGRTTVFKSVGLGLEDIAVAAYIYEQATLATKSADPTHAMR